MAEFVQISNVRVPQSELVPLLARSQLLPVVLRELTIDRAIIDIQCNDADKISAFQQFCDRHRLTSDDSIQRWLDFQYLNAQQFEEIVIRQFKIEKFKLANWGDKVEAYFLQRKSQLDRAIYSLIRTNDLGVAQEIYFRLLDGEQTFEDLARRYSEGAEAQTGGRRRRREPLRRGEGVGGRGADRVEEQAEVRRGARALAVAEGLAAPADDWMQQVLNSFNQLHSCFATRKAWNSNRCTTGSTA